MGRGRVFSQGDDWHRDTVVGGHLTELSYAVGYQAAAEALVEMALDARLQDLYFLPICYLYRHALELSLKDLIRQTDHLVCLAAEFGSIDRDACGKASSRVDRLLRSHNLKALLDELTERFALVGDQPIPDEVRSAVEDIDAFDPSAQTFRYPESTKGNPSFPTQEHYDLGYLHAALSGALEFFGGMGSWLDAQQTGYRDIET